MIAACTVPFTPAAPVAFVISEQRSTDVFNPTTGAWEPAAAPLTAADQKRLMVTMGAPTRFASLTPAAVPGSAELWANVGDVIPGDQIVAFRLALDTAGNPTVASPGQAPAWMDLSPAGRIEFDDGSVMLPAPGVGNSPPTVPGSTATP